MWEYLHHRNRQKLQIEVLLSSFLPFLPSFFPSFFVEHFYQHTSCHSTHHWNTLSLLFNSAEPPSVPIQPHYSFAQNTTFPLLFLSFTPMSPSGFNFCRTFFLTFPTKPHDSTPGFPLPALAVSTLSLARLCHLTTDSILLFISMPFSSVGPASSEAPIFGK